MRTQAAEKTEAAAGKARTAPRQNRIPSAPGLCVSTQETFARRQDNHGGPLSALFPWIFPMQPPQSRIRIYSDKILAIAPLSCDEEVIVRQTEVRASPPPRNLLSLLRKRSTFSGSELPSLGCR